MQIKIGGPFSKVSFDKYDLNSPDQLKEFLYTLGWIPDEWNYNKETRERTSPKITLSSLESIGSSNLGRWLERYYTLRHRRNLIKNIENPEGGKGLLNLLREDNRIEADALTCASKTFRMRHINVCNIPKCSSSVAYGCDIRSLFCVKPPYRMVGSDLKGIEARLIGHFTHLFDGGVMSKELLAGDIHTKNANLIGKDRNTAKTFFYALLYGSGPGKQASILGCSIKEAEGLIKNFFDGNPGLRDLIQYLNKFYQKHKYIRSIDGRRVPARSQHVLLNLLIQSSAAILFKDWSNKMWEEIEDNEIDAEIIILYHDELQCRVHKDVVDFFIMLLKSTLSRVRLEYNLLVDLDTDSKVGMNWGDTH